MKTRRSPHRSQQGDKCSTNCPSFSLPECFYINNTVSEITTPKRSLLFLLSHTNTFTYTQTESRENRCGVWTCAPCFGDSTTCCSKRACGVSCVFRQYVSTSSAPRGVWTHTACPLGCCFRGDLVLLIVSRRQFHQLALCRGTELCLGPWERPIGLV